MDRIIQEKGQYLTGLLGKKVLARGQFGWQLLGELQYHDNHWRVFASPSSWCEFATNVVHHVEIDFSGPVVLALRGRL